MYRPLSILLVALLIAGCSAKASTNNNDASTSTGDTSTTKPDAKAKSDTKVPIASDAGGAMDKLLVIWTSGDPDVALKMVMMYTLAAKKNKWWGSVRFLIWGPSAKLLSQDTKVQAELAKMKNAGVELLACKACADSYGVTSKLQSLGVSVKYMGSPLTGMLKSGEWKVVTF